ncbi:MAG: chorismate lyase [Gammaproteobacteria bacterium]
MLTQLQLNWQRYQPTLAISANLRAWLLHPGSFMQRLRANGVVNPEVQLLSQRWQFPELAEKNALGIASRSYALIREVLIVSEGKKWMFAQTVFPRETLTGKQRQLARLKNRSLGSVLFKDPTIERSEFDLICLQPGMPWHTAIMHDADLSATHLWARRSTFVLQQKPLLLTEVFLPDMESLCS